RLNYRGYRFAAPNENQFKTYTTRLDFRIDPVGNHRLFFRGVKQDDDVNGSPQFPGQAPSSVRTNKNWGYAIGYATVLSRILVNTFRYGLTKIDEATIGLQTASAVDFRFIDEFDALSSTSARE